MLQTKKAVTLACVKCGLLGSPPDPLHCANNVTAKKSNQQFTARLNCA